MRVLSIGEVMVELSGAGEGLWRMGFAGDTYNTAWHLAALRPGWRVAYGTRLGPDPMSQAALAAMAEAGIATDWVQRDPVRSIGLYLISLRDGERSFAYWRDTSAARLLADDDAWLNAALGWAEAIYFSGITLAILAPEARGRLLAALGRARAGGARIAFDPNLRPRLWESAASMRATIEAAAAEAELCLPSFEDEAAAFGDACAAATAARYAGLGVREVVVKNGDGQPALWVGGAALPAPAPPRVEPVDTTGAGDSFNAAYLAARLGGAEASQALAAGQALSALVVLHAGALAPRAALAAFVRDTALGAP
jgi:2-dehydro-3-deoxygluconokinase